MWSLNMSSNTNISTTSDRISASLSSVATDLTPSHVPVPNRTQPLPENLSSRLPRRPKRERIPNPHHLLDSSQSFAVSRSFPGASPSTPPQQPATSVLEALRALPEVRYPPWRPSFEPTDLSGEEWISNVHQTRGILLSTRGRITAEKCSFCEAGGGVFSECVVIKGWYQEQCGNCLWYGGEDGGVGIDGEGKGRCSLKRQWKGK
jgi:hypothetical protein